MIIKTQRTGFTILFSALFIFLIIVSNYMIYSIFFRTMAGKKV